MPQQTNLIDNRQIRVFISSTFQDMQDERDYLMKRAFPKLRKLAAERDVTLTELDLRWGITEEESQSGKVVEICLREIENSVPFFVGIIGNRYGWVPEKEDLGGNVTERFPAVEGYVKGGLSVTEMEMQFGVLDRKDDVHAFFYIKEQEESQDNPEMLKRLKQAVIDSKYPTSTYNSPEDLAEQVERAFTSLLDQLFPEGNLSELEKERIGQRSFMNKLCQNYIKDQHNFDVIDEWMKDWEKHQLVITGASGLGKSALIANWVKEQLSASDRPYELIYHFTGNGGSESTEGHIAKTLCEEIKDIYRFNDKTEDSGKSLDGDSDKDKELDGLFMKVASEGKKPLLIVLDAINQIADTDDAKLLNWLPIPPKNVKILFSTLEDDKTMEVFKNRNYPVFTLQPLDIERRRQLVNNYLSLFSKKLTEAQVTRIITDTQCENTLVLKTLLDELVNFGSYERLDEKIEFYLHADSVEDFYQSVLSSYEDEFGRQFVAHVLSLISVSRNGLSEDEMMSILNPDKDHPTITPLQWSQFYCSFMTHLKSANGLISFSHSFIRQSVDDRYIKPDKAYENACREEVVSLFKDSQDNRALDELPHQYFLLEDDDRLHDLLMDLDVFTYVFKKDVYGLTKYWNRLKAGGKYSVAEYHDLLRAQESYPVLVATKISDFCRKYIYEPQVALEVLEDKNITFEDKEQEAYFLNELGQSYDEIGEHKRALEFNLKALEIRQAILGDNYPDTAVSYDEVGHTYGYLTEHEKSLEFKLKALEIRQRIFGDNHPATSASYNNVGLTYGELGDRKRALEFQLKALEIQQRLFGYNHSDTATVYDNVGVTYEKLGEYEKSLEFQLKALDVRKSIFGDNHPRTATSYNNTGLSYRGIGDYERCLEFELKALEIRKAISGENHPDTATSYNNVGIAYGELGEHKRAIEFKLKALEINQSILSENHPFTAITYNSVGYTYSKLGEYELALEFQLKALEIRQTILGESHPDTANSYENVGLAYEDLGYYEESLEFQLKALKIRQEVLGERHSYTAASYENVSLSYRNIGDYEKCLEFELKALEIRQAIFGENHPNTATSYDNIAYVYELLNDYENEIQYLKKLLEIKAELENTLEDEIAIINNNIAGAYCKLAQFDKALVYENKAMEIAIAIDDIYLIADYHFGLAQIYKAMNEKESAREHFLKAAEMFQEIGDEEQAQENLQAANELN